MNDEDMGGCVEDEILIFSMMGTMGRMEDEIDSFMLGDMRFNSMFQEIGEDGEDVGRMQYRFSR